ATEALGYMGSGQPEIIDSLLKLLSDPNSQVRQAAVKTLGQVGRGQPKVIDSLLKLLFDYQLDVKQATVEALRLLDAREFHVIDTLLKSLVDFYRYTSEPYRQLKQATGETLKQLSRGQPEFARTLLNLIS